MPMTLKKGVKIARRSAANGRLVRFQVIGTFTALRAIGQTCQRHAGLRSSVGIRGRSDMRPCATSIAKAKGTELTLRRFHRATIRTSRKHDVSKMGPPPRSFRCDAHHCIMVWVFTHRIQGCGANVRATTRGLPLGLRHPEQVCHVDQELADMRQELKDLEKAIARQDPPLAPHTRAVAEAKIAALEHQIAAMMGGSGRQSALSK
jgi:hypothetical protein